MASLYDLTGTYSQIQELIEEGQDLEGILKTINEEIEIKAENYAKVMRNMEGDINAIEGEIKRLEERKQILANGITRMKDHLFQCMKAVKKEKFKTELFSFTIAKNGGVCPVDIPDESKVPMEYQKAKYVIDKEKIREDLLNGTDLGWAKIGERGESLRIK